MICGVWIKVPCLNPGLGSLEADPEQILVKVRECLKEKLVWKVRKGKQEFKDVIFNSSCSGMWRLISFNEEHWSMEVITELSHFQEHPYFPILVPRAM